MTKFTQYNLREDLMSTAFNQIFAFTNPSLESERVTLTRSRRPNNLRLVFAEAQPPGTRDWPNKWS